MSSERPPDEGGAVRAGGARRAPERGRRWKDGVLRALALPWEAGFAAAGALAPARAAPWSPLRGGRALVIAPHPDDEVAGCGGTILLHRDGGDDVTVLHATDGRRSRALGLGAAEMARRRRGEAEAAAALMDVALAWVGLPEWEWTEDELVPTLERTLGDVRPDVVYAPSRIDFHPEHRRVARALGRALERTLARGRDEPLVRIYEVQVPLTAILVNRVAAVAQVGGRARAALHAHETQVGTLRGTLRRKRYAGLRHLGGGEAEVFWELPARAYAALHGESSAAASAPGSGTPFRGMRRLPFTDPLAWLRGRSERRRLAREIGSQAAAVADGRAGPSSPPAALRRG